MLNFKQLIADDNLDKHLEPQRLKITLNNKTYPVRVRYTHHAYSSTYGKAQQYVPGQLDALIKHQADHGARDSQDLSRLREEQPKLEISVPAALQQIVFCTEREEVIFKQNKLLFELMQTNPYEPSYVELYRLNNVQLQKLYEQREKSLEQISRAIAEQELEDITNYSEPLQESLSKLVDPDRLVDADKLGSSQSPTPFLAEASSRAEGESLYDLVRFENKGKNKVAAASEQLSDDRANSLETFSESALVKQQKQLISEQPEAIVAPESLVEPKLLTNLSTSAPAQAAAEKAKSGTDSKYHYYTINYYTKELDTLCFNIEPSSPIYPHHLRQAELALSRVSFIFPMMLSDWPEELREVVACVASIRHVQRLLIDKVLGDVSQEALLELRTYLRNLTHNLAHKLQENDRADWLVKYVQEPTAIAPQLLLDTPLVTVDQANLDKLEDGKEEYLEFVDSRGKVIPVPELKAQPRSDSAQAANFSALTKLGTVIGAETNQARESGKPNCPGSAFSTSKDIGTEETKAQEETQKPSRSFMLEFSDACLNAEAQACAESPDQVLLAQAQKTAKLADIPKTQIGEFDPKDLLVDCFSLLSESAPVDGMMIEAYRHYHLKPEQENAPTKDAGAQTESTSQATAEAKSPAKPFFPRDEKICLAATVVAKDFYVDFLPIWDKAVKLADQLKTLSNALVGREDLRQALAGHLEVIEELMTAVGLIQELRLLQIAYFDVRKHHLLTEEQLNYALNKLTQQYHRQLNKLAEQSVSSTLRLSVIKQPENQGRVYYDSGFCEDYILTLFARIAQVEPTMPFYLAYLGEPDQDKQWALLEFLEDKLDKLKIYQTLLEPLPSIGIPEAQARFDLYWRYLVSLTTNLEAKYKRAEATLVYYCAEYIWQHVAREFGQQPDHKQIKAIYTSSLEQHTKIASWLSVYRDREDADKLLTQVELSQLRAQVTKYLDKFAQAQQAIAALDGAAKAPETTDSTKQAVTQQEPSAANNQPESAQVQVADQAALAKIKQALDTHQSLKPKELLTLVTWLQGFEPKDELTQHYYHSLVRELFANLKILVEAGKDKTTQEYSRSIGYLHDQVHKRYSNGLKGKVLSNFLRQRISELEAELSPEKASAPAGTTKDASREASTDASGEKSDLKANLKLAFYADKLALLARERRYGRLIRMIAEAELTVLKEDVYRVSLRYLEVLQFVLDTPMYQLAYLALVNLLCQAATREANCNLPHDKRGLAKAFLEQLQLLFATGKKKFVPELNQKQLEEFLEHHGYATELEKSTVRHYALTPEHAQVLASARPELEKLGNELSNVLEGDFAVFARFAEVAKDPRCKAEVHLIHNKLDQLKLDLSKVNNPVLIKCFALEGIRDKIDQLKKQVKTATKKLGLLSGADTSFTYHPADFPFIVRLASDELKFTPQMLKHYQQSYWDEETHQICRGWDLVTLGSFDFDGFYDANNGFSMYQNVAEILYSSSGEEVAQDDILSSLQHFQTVEDFVIAEDELDQLDQLFLTPLSYAPSSQDDLDVQTPALLVNSSTVKAHSPVNSEASTTKAFETNIAYSAAADYAELYGDEFALDDVDAQDNASFVEGFSDSGGRFAWMTSGTKVTPNRRLVEPTRWLLSFCLPFITERSMELDSELECCMLAHNGELYMRLKVPLTDEHCYSVIYKVGSDAEGISVDVVSAHLRSLDEEIEVPDESVWIKNRRVRTGDKLKWSEIFELFSVN